MRPEGKYKGIIFDMDNTILRSRIDFPAMKLDVFRLLVDYGAMDETFPLHEHTIATLLEACRSLGVLTGDQEQAVWRRVAEWEREGMEDADLEPGALEVLAALKDQYRLAILTNNAYAAAVEALETTGIIGLFDLIVGREQAGVLKPSPAGYFHIMAQYSDIERKQWLSVGDAWIDGFAAQQADIDFVQYRSREAEFVKRDIRSLGRLESLADLVVYL